MLSGLFSPKREVIRPGRKVVSPKRGYSRLDEKVPVAIVLSGVFSPRQEIFRSSKEVFYRDESIFAKAKKDPTL